MEHKEEKVGLKSLLKRVKQGKIIITVGYKYKRLFVSSMKSYKRQGLVHTKLGKKVGWKDIRVSQRLVTAVARTFSNIFKLSQMG